MKVLFIYTDVGIEVGYSCGIGVLSACLKQAGHGVRLIHVSEELAYPFDLERIRRDVDAYGPGLVAFSVVTNQWHFVKQVIRSLRGSIRAPIVIGGHHADAVPLEVLAEPGVDYVCKGEGERALVELADRLEQGRPTGAIAGMVYQTAAARVSAMVGEPAPGRSAAGAWANGPACRVRDNKVGPWVQDLDELPFEDRDIFDYARIVRSRYGWAEVIASRGCPYACTYCFNQRFFERYRDDLAGTDRAVTRRDFVRRRSPASLVEMLKDIRREYADVKYFTFVDDAFAIDEAWLEQLAPLYIGEIGVPFACTSQPLAFNERIAALLKSMRCKVVKMGVEAGSETLRRKLLRRPISNDVLRRAFRIARRYELKPQAFNMIGLPTETWQDMLETVRINAQLRAYIVWVSVFLPYPGTALHDFCVEEGLIDEARWDDVHSYRGGSVLRESSFTHLELEQIRTLFRAYLNVFLDNECSAEYRELVDEMLALDASQWRDGRAAKLFRRREAQLDQACRTRNVDHYVSKKYVSILWAEEYGFDVT